ncbi:unnamed protein product, partial [Discosporangium mesarthrocarpum]
PHVVVSCSPNARHRIFPGVVASLSARCSILAAANPIGGHYNRSKTVAENLKMSAALLSRFDMIFILLDRPDEDHDKMLSDHIMRLHKVAGEPPGKDGCGDKKRQQQLQNGNWAPPGRGGFGREARAGTGPEGWAGAGAGAGGGGGAIRAGEGEREQRTLSQRLRVSCAVYQQDPVPTELLKKYVAYARAYCHPRLTVSAARVLQKLYLAMRSEARDGRSVPVTMRQLESLVRLSQARAKVELREEVTAQDAKDVVDMMQESLLEAYMTDTGAIDFGRSGATSLAKQVKVFVSNLTKRASQKGSALFPQQELRQLAEDLSLRITDFEGFLDVLRQVRQGCLFEV